MSTPYRGRGVVSISNELLAEWLGLPETTRVVSVLPSEHDFYSFRVLLQDNDGNPMGLPEEDGTVHRTGTLVITQERRTIRYSE